MRKRFRLCGRSWDCDKAIRSYHSTECDAKSLKKACVLSLTCYDFWGGGFTDGKRTISDTDGADVLHSPALTEECCGVDIMDKVDSLSAGRVKVGREYLYAMLSKFEDNEIIKRTKKKADGSGIG